jgi:hypothetical protein
MKYVGQFFFVPTLVFFGVSGGCKKIGPKIGFFLVWSSHISGIVTVKWCFSKCFSIILSCLLLLLIAFFSPLYCSCCSFILEYAYSLVIYLGHFGHLGPFEVM